MRSQGGRHRRRGGQQVGIRATGLFKHGRLRCGATDGLHIESVAQALDHIEVAPESDAASHLMACLTQWFFLEKLPL